MVYKIIEKYEFYRCEIIAAPYSGDFKHFSKLFKLS